MSSIVPVPATETHYFAGPLGHVFEVIYEPKAEAYGWSANFTAGALSVPIDGRKPAIEEIQAYALEAWPGCGGAMRIDHKGHMA